MKIIIKILVVADADHLEILECFSQMLIGRNIFVTANNFFPFDFSFVFSLIGTVATYTVILMQVNETPPNLDANPNNFTNASLS